MPFKWVELGLESRQCNRPIAPGTERGARYPWLLAASATTAVLACAVLLIFAGGSFIRSPEARIAWLKSEPPTVAVTETPAEEPQPDEPDTRQVAVQSGDTLSEILTEAGADPAEARAAIAALSSVYDASSLREGQSVSVTFDALPVGATPALAAPAPTGPAGGASEDEALVEAPPIYAPLLTIALKPSVEREVYVQRNPDGTFAAIEVVKQLTPKEARAQGVIDGSLYLSAKAAGVPEAVIVDLIRIYSHDVDFQREIRAGDAFDLVYTTHVDDTGETIKGGAIQYAELTLSGEKKPLYRFSTSDDQITDYFTPKGFSGKRLLMRTPVDGARLTSKFGVRRHPILGYNKLHRGVDFGAPSGTPVMAAGNGTVDMAGWHGGYGRYVRLRHANSYRTAYAHLSRFARGISRGTRVRQGQIIGYVGSSGRSTGPHLHYEVLVNTKQINPMGVKLPTGRHLAGKDLAAFQSEVARVAELLNTLPSTPSLVAGGALLETQALR